MMLELETPRVRLRPYTPDDLDPLAGAMDRPVADGRLDSDFSNLRGNAGAVVLNTWRAEAVDAKQWN